MNGKTREGAGPTPPGLAITGGLCVVCGGLLALCGALFGFAGEVSRSMREQGLDPFAASGVRLDPLSGALLAHSRGVAGLLAGFGVVSVVLGVQFLRRRSWARPALEILAWVVLAASILGEAYLLGPGRSWGSGGGGAAGFLAGPVASLGTTLLQVVACILIIRYLRSGAVREVFRGRP